MFWLFVICIVVFALFLYHALEQRTVLSFILAVVFALCLAYLAREPQRDCVNACVKAAKEAHEVQP